MGKENQESTGSSQSPSWTFVLPIGALTLLGALMLSVSNEASNALRLSTQHGESILLIREEIKLLRSEQRNAYTNKDAERDLAYIRRDIGELKQAVKEAHRD
jgi:hypothetical protein